jgi:hypothetical protein
MATIQELESALLKADAAGNVDDARAFASEIRKLRQPPQPVKMETMEESIKAELGSRNWADRQIIAAGTGLSNVIQGAKQLIPGMKADTGTIQANRVIASENPGAAFAGNLALFAPTAAVPALNTYTGAGVAGGLMGALQPVLEGESRGANTALGFGGGVAGKFVGDRLTQALQSTTASEAARQGRNALKDRVLDESQKAGYVLPKSEVAPSFLNNRLESIAGKAALKQESTLRNQEVTNRLGRELLGLSDDQPITKQAFTDFRNKVAEPYRQIEALDNRAAIASEALKKVRNEAQAQWNYYNRSANPDALNIAKALDQKAEMLETAIDKIASSKGQPELLSQLRQSRKQIAQSYDLQRGLNPATGDISAPVIGRLMDKKPLSDNLATIANFNRAYPKFSGPGASTPAAGISALEPMSMAGYGAIGQAASGDARGLLAAGIPLLRDPVRSILLSRPYQSMVSPSYGPGLLTQAGGLLANQLPMAGAYGAVEALR